MREISTPLDGFASPFGSQRVGFGSYMLEGVDPTLIFDPANGVIGSRQLGQEDYTLELTRAVLVFDPASNFTGASS